MRQESLLLRKAASHLKPFIGVVEEPLVLDEEYGEQGDPSNGPMGRPQTEDEVVSTFVFFNPNHRCISLS